MKKYTLTLDTTSVDKLRISLDGNGTHAEMVFQGEGYRAENILVCVDTLLKKLNKTLSDIDNIRVQRGPGSFTGLRVGLAIGNMLSLLLSVPINGRPPGTCIVPVYKK